MGKTRTQRVICRRQDTEIYQDISAFYFPLSYYISGAIRLDDLRPRRITPISLLLVAVVTGRYIEKI